MQLNDPPKNVKQRCEPLQGDWTTWAEDWPRPRLKVLLPLLLLLAVLILLCGCNAASTPVVRQTWTCRVPAADLQPREEPPMQDDTVEALVKEAGKLRETLQLSEADKARVATYVRERCTDVTFN